MVADFRAAALLLVKRLAALLLPVALLAAAPVHAEVQIVQKRVQRPPNTLGNLIDLSETLGAVHYLQVVCKGRQDQTWRNHMIQLLNAENPGVPMRESMVAAFNRGYRSQERLFSTCDARVKAQIRIKAQQGQILSNALGDPYHQ